MSKWITIEEIGKSDSGKTTIFGVFTKDGGIELGQIRWFSSWRKYAFFPDTYTIFEQDCLRDIADSIENKTQEHRAKK